MDLKKLTNGDVFYFWFGIAWLLTAVILNKFNLPVVEISFALMILAFSMPFIAMKFNKVGKWFFGKYFN